MVKNLGLKIKQNNPKLTPWYRNFTGDIYVKGKSYFTSGVIGEKRK